MSAGKRPTFTLGIEEEYQVIDPATGELKSNIQEMFAQGQSILKEEMKRELHDPVIEVGTPICADIGEARRELTRLRSQVIGLAAKHGLQIAAAGTHPFTDWATVPTTPGAHYDALVEDLQMVARANLIFGLHVHVAVEDDEARVAIMSGVRYFLPHIFALSVNSPFWVGQNTGWKSFRAKIFERFPRTGLPEAFDSWSAYQDFLNTLIATGCIKDGKKIWWDVRVHPYFPTLEYRICDIPMRIDETLCLAAIFQAVTYKLWKLYDANLDWRHYRRMLINENKWRAARFGLDGKLIDLGKKIEVPTPSLLVELLEFIDDVVVELGVKDEVLYVHEILRHRTGADRQLAVYEETHDLRAVVQYIVEETKAGIRLVDVRRTYDERFSFVRVERASDLPARDERIVDVALLDMNCGFANVGHDAIVEIVRAATSDVADDLERDDKRVRVISYALRDRHMVPDYRSSRHMLYLGTGGPGHLDPRRNTMERGAEEISEDAAWEPPLWALFDAIADDERISLYGVCHTFGLICRWSGIADPVLRGSEKGGAKSGVGNNVLTAQGMRHPYFRTLADVSPGGAIPVLDSRHYDLIPTGRMRPGATAIAFEANRAGERAGDALTMLEIARDADGYPRMFACNNHPEIGAADDVAQILRNLLDIGTIDRETFERRSAVLPVLRNDRASERLRASRIVFGDLIRTKVRRLVRGT